MKDRAPREARIGDFKDLVETYGQEIFMYLFRVFEGRGEAEDCFQETLLRAFKAYPRARQDSNYRAWLYTIATNTARTIFRQGQRREQRELAAANRADDYHDSLLDTVSHNLQLAKVKEAVENLPRKQRLALILRKYHDLSYDEVGQVLSCSAESARANVYQAVRRLRTEFSREGEGEHGQD